MAEDIDDLLDEVELKFCRNQRAPKGGRLVNSIAKEDVSSKKTTKDESDLQAIIADICADSGPSYQPHSSCENKKGNNACSLNKARKCYPIYLGGSKHATGLSSASMQNTCDELRCTSCDFQVVFFDNYQWNSVCDYLFFRNNIPDFSKLKVNLVNKPGCRAYACQCSWRSVKELQNIERDAKLRWVCGKHL